MTCSGFRWPNLARARPFGTNKLDGIEEVRVASTASFTLEGSSGNDVLRGGAGNDLIKGLQGADTLFGGEGADRFVFTSSDTGSGTQRDVIADMQIGDRIELPSGLTWVASGTGAAGNAWYGTANGGTIYFQPSGESTAREILVSNSGSFSWSAEAGPGGSLVLLASLPAPGAPVLKASSDSGLSESDRITASTRPSFDITVPATVAAGSRLELIAES
ncbi:MAG: hypothetical protein EBV34_18780, partial [Betaproteobacteria bacterium]|nr:hypothetical protein [Betaproteobacteria bacterium]